MQRRRSRCGPALLLPGWQDSFLIVDEAGVTLRDDRDFAIKGGIAMRARAFSKQKFRLCTAFCSANMLLILPAPVFADSGVIHLTCRPSGSAANVMIQDDPTIVDLDKAQATATVHFASFRLQGSISGPLPARTV